jgi:predicted acylesterase/phospholipase RssA
MNVGMATASEQKFRHCDLLIAPQPLSQYRTFSINHIDEIFRIGYQEASQALQKMERGF